MKKRNRQSDYEDCAILFCSDGEQLKNFKKENVMVKFGKKCEFEKDKARSSRTNEEAAKIAQTEITEPLNRTVIVGPEGRG